MSEPAGGTTATVEATCHRGHHIARTFEGPDIELARVDVHPQLLDKPWVFQGGSLDGQDSSFIFRGDAPVGHEVTIGSERYRVIEVRFDCVVARATPDANETEHDPG